MTGAATLLARTPEHYDTRESRDPALRERDLMARLLAPRENPPPAEPAYYVPPARRPASIAAQRRLTRQRHLARQRSRSAADPAAD